MKHNIRLKTKDICRIFDIDATVVKKMVKDGCPYEKTPGGHYRFILDEVSRFMKNDHN